MLKLSSINKSGLLQEMKQDQFVKPHAELLEAEKKPASALIVFLASHFLKDYQRYKLKEK